MISGLQIIPLKRVPDDRGTIFHMLRRTDPHFIEFGEVYFSSIYRGVIKGWHRHSDMTLNYACIFGRVKLVVYDDRDESPTRGEITEVFLGPDNYSLVVIPPGLWNGHMGMSDPYAIIANCATHPHDPARSERIDPLQSHIPYHWEVKHR
jgi:dTDP-4-dehydrorhamnose 3,5-epimerase